MKANASTKYKHNKDKEHNSAETMMIVDVNLLRKSTIILILMVSLVVKMVDQ